MASLVGLPIPRIPASVRRDYVGRTLRTLYAERPSLIHLDYRFRPIPRIHRLRLAFNRRVAGGVLRRARCGVAGSVARCIRGTAISLAGAHGRLSRELGRLPINTANIPAELGALVSLVRRVVQLFRILGNLRHG